MTKISCKRHRFPAEIIQHAVWLYFRFTLSFRDVEELLVGRGLDVSYESIRCWVLKFGKQYARRIDQDRPHPSCRWHLAEVFVTMTGKRMYLWRAVDDEGEVLEVLVQSRQNKKAALKLMRKLLTKQGFIASAFVTDKLPSYGAALRYLGLSRCHVLVAERTIELKIHIRLFDDEKPRCSGSSQPVQRNVFSQFIPPSTICPTVNAI